MPRKSEPLQKHFDYDTVEHNEVLQDELARIQLRRNRAVASKLLPAEPDQTSPDAVAASLTGLALSGGGIRSGAVGLGVLQGLYRGGLLPFFDYLSTVSGGGYAGAYLTSAGSHGHGRSDDADSQSASLEDTTPYGRLKAFHDGEGQSERMQQFIFGGHYLLRTRRFFNRHLMGLLALWTITLSGLASLALAAAMLFRMLDQPLPVNFLAGLGLRTDISRGLFPVTFLIVLWGLCWAVSFFRAAGHLANARGRSAAALIPVIVGTFGICLAALLGNGEFNLDWLSTEGGMDFSSLFSSAEEFLRIVIFSVIGIGLLPYLNPIALIRSGARPASTSDRVVFSIASRVLLYGLPFVFVSWFARENMCEWTEHRFVPTEIQDLGVRAADLELAKNTHETAASNLVTAQQTLELVRGELDDIQAKLANAQANIDEPAAPSVARTSEETADQDTADNRNQHPAARTYADARKRYDEAIEAVAMAQAHYDSSRNERVDFVALTRREIANWGDWQPAWAPLWAQLRVEMDHLQLSPEDRQTEAAKTKPQGTGIISQLFTGVVAAETDRSAVSETGTSRHGNSASHAPPIADYIWSELDSRVAEGTVTLPALPASNGQPHVGVELVTFTDLNDVLEFIHKESLELQVLYARESQSTDGYAPDAPHLIAYRVMSLLALFPDTIQGNADQNYFGRFICYRKRLSIVRAWLADHLSRILETSNLGTDCDWSDVARNNDPEKLKHLPPSERSRVEALIPLCERAALLKGRHNTSNRASATEELIHKLSDAEFREVARLNREILSAAFPGTLRDPSTVHAANVLEFDQARRWTMFKWCFGLFLVSCVMININATSLHSFYARELTNNWIETGKDADIPLSSVDPTEQSLPYHIISGSVHWSGRRNKPKADQQRDHFLLSPRYCGCKATGFVRTNEYKNDEIGLGDAIAISGAAVSPVQQGNPLLQVLLWLGNLRLGQWLPNPSHGTFLPTRSRDLVANIPVTPWRVLTRLFQPAEKRPFVFVTDGGHHENLGIGPLLERRCRFMLAIDSGEDPDYAFSDLSRLMRWTRVKHNIRLQPVESIVDDPSQTGVSLSESSGRPLSVMASLKSSINAWNALAPENEERLTKDRLSSRHFVVLRVHYPDVDGPSWLIYAKTSLTGDEPAELIRHAESDKQFPHNPTSNQFYAPDTFEAYRQLGEHIVESMIGQLPSIISGKLHEHRGRSEAEYLGGLFKQICTARDALPLTMTAAPPTPEAITFIQNLGDGDGTPELQNSIARRLSMHPLMVSRLFDAALRSEVRINARLTSFLFPEFAPEASLVRNLCEAYPLPGRAEAMAAFNPSDTFSPNDEMIDNLLKLGEHLTTASQEASAARRVWLNKEYRAVYRLLRTVSDCVLNRALRERISELPPAE